MSIGRETALKFIEGKSSLDVLFSIPCFICPNLDRCGIGQEHTPLECPELSHWVTEQLEKSVD